MIFFQFAGKSVSISQRLKARDFPSELKHEGGMIFLRNFQPSVSYVTGLLHGSNVFPKIVVLRTRRIGRESAQDREAVPESAL